MLLLILLCKELTFFLKKRFIFHFTLLGYLNVQGTRALLTVMITIFIGDSFKGF